MICLILFLLTIKNARSKLRRLIAMSGSFKYSKITFLCFCTEEMSIFAMSLKVFKAMYL